MKSVLNRSTGKIFSKIQKHRKMIEVVHLSLLQLLETKLEATQLALALGPDIQLAKDQPSTPTSGHP